MACEKIYGLAIHCSRVFELRNNDFGIGAMSFLKLADELVGEKETMVRIVKDIEAITKSLSDKLTKIKSRPW